MSSYSIPTAARAMLSGFTGRKVVRMLRYSLWPLEEAAAEAEIDEVSLFSLCSGPMAIYFDNGSVLGLASDSEENSVVVRIERSAEGVLDEYALEHDSDIFSIDSTDARFSTPFWSSLNGLKLTRFELIRSSALNAVEQLRPSELGLCFVFENDQRFIASHGLHDGTDDFSVLELHQISVETREALLLSPL
ncbi:hypothetical protein IEQ11_05345 [Lysobacter capsici]|uniref:hypothetical protein n=1 Tax=Lysobacter capsici TaxID=435897 RepID=UPI00177F5491|nr:hypothetical protein [Lysobacter capsici]UOF16082.1 hypothetical protein IEQ11_05345 [Lysobacter capsici]